MTEYIEAHKGIMVISAHHAFVPPGGLMPSLNEPLHVAKLIGVDQDYQEQTIVLLLRPGVAADLAASVLYVATRSGTERLVAEQMGHTLRRASGGDCNVAFIHPQEN